jgi:hypothetical protein
MKVTPALLAVTLLAISRPTAADAPQALHTAFTFWTHDPNAAGDAGDIYYTENLKRSMTVTTAFNHWQCTREPVVMTKDGWKGAFMCTAIGADGAGLMTMVDEGCSPNVVTPLRVNMGKVSEMDAVSKKVDTLQLIAACVTSPDVPRRGEIKP